MVNFIKHYRWLILILALALILRFSIMFYVYHGDVYNHIAWGIYAVHYGLRGIYEQPFNLPTDYQVNQPPGTVFIFMAMRYVYEGLDKLLWFLNNHIGAFPSRFLWFYEANFYPALLKVPAILCDIGIGIVLYLFTKKYTTEKKALLVSALFVFNPITLYNSAVWGQTDATVNLFGILAFYFLTERKLFWAIAAMTLSLFIKASLLVFTPLFILLILRQRYDLKRALAYCLLMLVVLFVITLPFHGLNDPLWLFSTYKDRVLFGSLNSTSEDAFNFWALIYGTSPHLPAYTKFLGMAASRWGYSAFAVVLAPVLYRQWKRPTIVTMLANLVLLGFTSYLFFTGMHERYLYPIFAPLALLLVYKPKYIWLYIVCSIIHLTNLYYQWWAPTITAIKNFLLLPYVVDGFIIALFVCYGVFVLSQFFYKFNSEHDTMLPGVVPQTAPTHP